MNARRLVTLAKLLVAVVAIGSLATPAKADLSLSFSSGGSEVFSVTGLTDGAHGTANFGEFSVAYTVHSNTVAASGGAVTTLSLDAVVTTSSQATSSMDRLSWNLAQTGVKAPNPSETLTTGLSVLDYSVGTPTKTAGERIELNNVRSVYNPNGFDGTYNTNSGPISWSSSPGAMTTGTGSWTDTADILQSAPTYTLRNAGALVVRTTNNNGQSSSIHFVSSSVVFGVPEPSGLVAALAGVPCGGLLLGALRRRLGAVSATA